VGGRKKLEDLVNSLIIEVEELKKRIKQIEDEIAKEKKRRRWI